MERGSDKHGPLQDENLKHELEGVERGGHSTHAEEWREVEPSGEDQPETDLAPDELLVGDTPDGMDGSDVAGRSELASYLGKEVWPATASALVEAARGQQAPDAVLQRLSALPEGRTYANVNEVWSDLGGGVEQHRF